LRPGSTVAAAVALVVLSAGTAWGQPAPGSVEVSVQSCSDVPPVAVEPFLGILTAELRADGVERVTLGSAAAEQSQPPSLAVIAIKALTCDPQQRDIVVRIEDAATRKRVERRVQLADVAELSRPRALALAVAELLRACWLELAMPEAPPPQVPVPPVVRRAVESRVVAMAPPQPSAPPSGDRDVSVTLAWDAFPTAHASLLGGQVAVALPVLGKDWRVRVDSGAVFGTAHDVLGDVAIGQARMGVAFLYSSPAEATVSVAVGPRVDAGIAWAEGNPADQTTSSNVGWRFVSSVSLLGTLRYRLGRSWSAALELQAGSVVVPLEAQADSRRVTGIDGAFFGLAVGVAQLR